MDAQQLTLLSTLFNESLDAILILDLKTQKFILFNQKALELYFYRASNWHPEYNAMNFKSEVIAFKGFFGAKKFYGLGIIWKEGTFYDELDLKTTGGQIKKADITKVTKEMLSEIYILLCLKLEATDQKLMYNTIFKKIKETSCI